MSPRLRALTRWPRAVTRWPGPRFLWRPRARSVRALAVLAGALVVAAGLAGTIPARASVSLAAPVPFAVGLSPGSGMLYVPAAAVRASMVAMAATGHRWVRLDIPWAMVQSRPGRSDWGPEDTAVTAARAAGLSVDAVIDYAPGWAVHGHRPDAAAYGAFVTRAVERYSPLGVHT